MNNSEALVFSSFRSVKTKMWEKYGKECKVILQYGVTAMRVVGAY